MSLTSCKKDSQCECTVNGQTNPIPIDNMTKSDAKDACDAGISVNGETVSSDCSLKSK